MQEGNGLNSGNQIRINGQVVQPGESSVIKLNVGRLPSDTRIYVHLHVFNSLHPGPVILVLAGIHGDEINGVEIVRRSIEQNYFADLKCGTVIAIPLLNVFGFINFSRDAPDGKDVNRSFPGSMNGSLASRVARLLTKNVLPSVDLIIDFHTGGASRYNYPQIRCTRGDDASFELAKSFNPPFILYKPIISRSLRKVAKNRKMPILIFEGGEALRLDGFTINRGLLGLDRILVSQKMSDKLLSPPARTVLIEKSSWIRANASGIFTWNKSSGAFVKKGEPIGMINDPNGFKRVIVLANREGFIIGHNNAPVVNQGNALFNIGYVYKEVENADPL
jgi:predicted deacylase